MNINIIMFLILITIEELSFRLTFVSGLVLYFLIN